MSKSTTNSFTHTLKLSPLEYQKVILDNSFDTSRQLYNNGLGELFRRRKLMKNSKEYKKVNKIFKEYKKQEKALEKNPELKIKNKIIQKDFKSKYNDLYLKYGFSEYSIQAYVTKQKNSQFKKLIGGDETQKVGTRIWKSMSDFHFKNKGKPKFKRYGLFNSIEGKSSKSSLKFKDGKCLYLKEEIKVIYDLKDTYNIQSHALNSRVKYSRITREYINGEFIYFLQLILEGKPLIKDKNKTPKEFIGNTISFDLGPQSIGVVSKNNNISELNILLPEIERISKKRIQLQKQLSKKLRLNNPNNFEDNKIIKKKIKNKNGTRKRNIKTKQKLGKIIQTNEKLVWKNSKSYLDLKNLLTELHRKETLKRKEFHNRFINKLLRLGDNFSFEKLSYKGWQKLFGRSVGSKSPGLFIEKLKYKTELNNGQILEINTRLTKLSQTCVCGKVKKKKLGERFHNCECGLSFQRDMLSAYLALFVKLDKDGKHYLDIIEAQKLLSGFELSLNNAVLKYQTSSSSVLKTLGFSKSELERFALLISNKKLSVRENIVGRNTESLHLGKQVLLEPTLFSVW